MPQAAGIPSAEDASRGFDHGTFVPLKLMFPGADIPVVQMSVMSSMDPEAHMAVSPCSEYKLEVDGQATSLPQMHGCRTLTRAGCVTRACGMVPHGPAGGPGSGASA